MLACAAAHIAVYRCVAITAVPFTCFTCPELITSKCLHACPHALAVLPKQISVTTLQDANLPGPLLREAYQELLLIIWRLYRVAKLVHGDLSEYNILYHERQVYIIDVSQSVDLDHPKALEFLREDCKHVNDFFRRAGVAVLSVRELFDWVTDPLVTDETTDEVLDSLQQVRRNHWPAIRRVLYCWQACALSCSARQLLQVS